MGFARRASPRRSGIRSQKKGSGHQTGRAHHKALAKQLGVKLEEISSGPPKREKVHKKGDLSVRQQASMSSELCQGVQ